MTIATHIPFVHLHTHTEYSFLDGAIKIKELVKKAVEYGMKSLAITDHGGMFGVPEFYIACMEAGIKPVIGFEAYVAPQSRFDKNRSDEDAYNHLILLAKNQDGYRNLMKLSSIGYTEGFYYKPRIDMEVLRSHAAGIIATSACIAGTIPRAIIAGRMDKARKVLEEYLGIFGRENFYIELQDHGIKEEKVANEGLRALGTEMGVPFIVANDAHYLNRDDAVSHEVLLAIQTQATMSDPKRYRFTSDQIYFKSPVEMAALFPDLPEAMSNTVRIAEMCNVQVTTKKHSLPKSEVPEGFEGEGEYLAHLTHKGLKERYEHVTPGLEERLAYELGVIHKMGFDGYFLVVRDFVMAAQRMGIMVGCRGSAAGSLVAYTVGITSVDPVKFDLLFERFLNPERVSLPDADIDFADKDRHKVINYVVEKYGRDAVCQIINFGRMKSKMVIKDVARAMGIPIADANRLSGMVNEKTLKESLSGNGELTRLIADNPQYKELFKHGEALEGLARQAGMHAGGVIIAPGPVVDWAPLFKQQSADEVMTQYDMNYVEKVGLVKMDFLGLSTLSVQQEAINLIRKHHGLHLDVWKLPEGDPKTYDLFGKGDTIGIFQFESQGMQDYLRKLKPTNIEDLIAMNALYRPGPMENIDMYIRRKHGKEKVEYHHPILKNVLDVTYGVIIYQEQVMRVVQEMAGFSLGEADLLRRAMSKKKAEEMEAAGQKFVAGATAKGVEKKIAEEVFELIARFAQYGFNKSHATVYAHVAYQSGYLKSHYPLEYMTANLTTYMDDEDYFLSLKADAERMGIQILPPDVTTSEMVCSIEEGKLRLGLSFVKNVGKAAEVIVAERQKSGRFTSIFNLCKRSDTRLVNKKALESLAYAGALDALSGTRAQFVAAIEKALEFAGSFQKEQDLGQISMFDTVSSGEAGQGGLILPEPVLPDVEPWPYNEVLAREKELLGFYISGHPLDRYRDEVTGFSSTTLSAERTALLKPEQSVTVGGLLVTVKQIVTKTGKAMAFCDIEDFDGKIELVMFSEPFEKFKHLLAPDTMVLVHGKVNFKDGDPKPKILVDNILPLSESRDKLTKSVHIKLHSQGLEPDFLEDLCSACGSAGGVCGLVVHLVTQESNEYRIRSRKYKVDPQIKTIERLREKLGKGNVWISKVAA